VLNLPRKQHPASTARHHNSTHNIPCKENTKMSFLRPVLRCKNLRIRNLRGLATASNAPSQHQATSNRIRLVEVGPRDGLQNEKRTIPLTTKIELISRLARTGLTDIEAGSFVAPKWVPQVSSIMPQLPRIGAATNRSFYRWQTPMK